MTHSDVLVIGAGQAAMTLARSLREFGYGGSITLVGDEPLPPYERPPLSKAFLTEPASEPTCFAPESWWRENAVTLVLGETAASIDPACKMVALASGASLGYGRLVIATGGRARQADGLTLRSAEDARRLAERLGIARSVCVVGGGFLGLEIAASARSRGLDAVVIEAAQRVVPAILPPVLSEWLQDLHAAWGTAIHCGASVTSTTVAPSGRTLVSAGPGVEIEADCLVTAIGMVPNVELAASAGLAVQGGVVVDALCRTSVQDVYAIGDVSCTLDPRGGAPRRIESWQNAERQGVVAAAHIAGREPPAAPVAWFWTEQYARSIQVLGSLGAGEVVWRGAPTDASFVAVNLFEDRIVGAFGVDAGKELAPLRQLIALGAPVRADELATGTSLRELLAAVRRRQ